MPPEAMARLKAQQGAPAQLPGGGSPGPASAPMAKPQEAAGEKMQAKVKIHIAMNMLEQALGAFGAESKEGGAVLSVLQKLGRQFGDQDASDLVPAQIRELASSTPGMGAMPPQQQKIAQMMGQNGPAKIPQPPAPMPAPM